MDAPLNEIATRLRATTDQVLLAWIKAKGAVVVTCVFMNSLGGDVVDVETRQYQL